MPPKVKTTKKEIISAALKIVRASGEQALNARNIALQLNCSTQPIFSNFATMDALRIEVVKSATALYQEYIQREVERAEYPSYKASGMAYIRFAKEEKELFKLLYMRNRSAEVIPENDENFDKMVAIVSKNLGLNAQDAKIFHLETWAYVHGIAVMFATDFLNLDWNLVSKMLTDVYLGLKNQYITE